MTNAEIVSKLWNLCNVLRDDGITYHQYVTELTYILFLKMAKETGSEKNIPEGYRWDVLKSKEGMELKRFYDELLRELGENCTGRVQEIYQGARSNIEEPANLKKIITNIDELDWYSANITLASKEEQDVIVELLQKMFAKEDYGKAMTERFIEQIDMVKKAILAKAFRGELGTNNSEEDSTIELLKAVLSQE